MSYETERAELERKLNTSRTMQQKERELKAARQQEEEQRKHDQEIARRVAAEETDRRELAALKTQASAQWPGSTESFERFWANGGAEQARVREFERRMANRKPIATLDD